MNIKSLLIGSAAALAAVSGAQAADAIVAAEPEAVEYVRVCDAFGTGYFYIPGTETCLKISGYARVQVNIANTSDNSPYDASSQYSDYDVFARGLLNFEAKNDTEYGVLTSHVRLIGKASEITSRDSNNVTTYDNSAVELEYAYIDLAGFRAGKFHSIWDDGLKGETDKLSSNSLFASVRYQYAADAFTVGLSLDELLDKDVPKYKDANLGIAPYLSASFGGVKFTINGGYDFDAEEGAVRGILSANVGPGTFQLAGIYASGVNTYYKRSEWTVAAAYAFQASEKLVLTPGFQYYGNYGIQAAPNANKFTNLDAWAAGLTAEYKVTSGLTALATVNYFDRDGQDGNVRGFLRLERSF